MSGEDREPRHRETRHGETRHGETPRREARTSSGRLPWRRLRRAMAPRATRAQALAALLCAVLGFALVVQARQTQESDLAQLRQSDLVRILDDVTERGDRLDAEARDLQRTLEELRDGSSAAEAAADVAEERAATLGVLAGTAPATGPGVVVEVFDPDATVPARRLLDALQELRNAGAEAVQVEGTVAEEGGGGTAAVRVVASTAFTDHDEGVEVDGTPLLPPYRFVAIGDPDTISTALDIPGGVVSSISSDGGRAVVREEDEVVVDAVVDDAPGEDP